MTTPSVSKNLIHRDLAFGIATLAIAAGYYLMAVRIPQSQLADAIGPQGLPKTYAAMLAGLSLILIVRSLVRRRVASPASAVSQEPSVQRYRLSRVAGMLTIGVVYVLVVPWLGYVLSLTGLIVATTYYQGGGINRQVALVAVSGAVFFWFLFVWLLRIPHPAGLWSSFF